MLTTVTVPSPTVTPRAQRPRAERQHYTSHGTPKVAYTRADACTTAEQVNNRPGWFALVHPYRCRVCHRYHLGRGPARRLPWRLSGRFRRILDHLESDDRVTVALLRENTGSRNDRLSTIGARFTETHRP